VTSIGHRLCSHLRYLGQNKCHRGILSVFCDDGDDWRPEICARPDKELQCLARNAEASGAHLREHYRVVGAPHVLCGSAGINESVIRWPDGQGEDKQVYVRAKARVYEVATTSVEEWRGPVGRPAR